MAEGSVLISGMGIAGPTLAFWLLRHGFRPTLIEHAPGLRTGGYVIDFWGLGYDIAERMGLLPDLRAHGYDVRELRFVDAHGRRVGGFGVDVFRVLAQGRYVSLPRGDLAKLIYEKIDGRCEVFFDDAITEISQSEESLRVRFAKARERTFDLVVGADGLHSVVRRLVFGSEQSFEAFLGYTAAAFEAEAYEPRDEDVYVSYGLPGRQIARFAMRHDRTVFLFVFATERALPIEPNDLAAQKRAIHAAFDATGWECPQILAALDRCDQLYFDPVSQIRMPAWSRGRVALIGDAAFCPSLLAGQGSALAMLAAYILAGELAASDPPRAFARYEERMRGFILEKQTGAQRFARSFAPRTRWGLIFRNQVTKLFAIPGLAKFAMGPSLLDRLELPDYGAD